MSTTTYFPQLFIESSSSIPEGLANIAKEVDNFKHSMSTAAGLLDGAIATVNSGNHDSIVQKKRELRSCRENFMKTLACSATFIDRYNKLLRYADMDDEWKGKMVDSASKGDYKSFTAYITQIERFLEQLYQTYQDFVQACSNAEAQCNGLPMVSSTPSHLPGDEGALSSFQKCLAAIFTYLIGRRCGNIFLRDDHERVINNTAMAIQYHGYDSIREPAAKIYSSSRRFQNDLKSLQASSELKENISTISFNSALDLLLNEVRRAHYIVNPCYEALDTGTSVRTVNIY